MVSGPPPPTPSETLLLKDGLSASDGQWPLAVQCTVGFSIKQATCGFTWHLLKSPSCVGWQLIAWCTCTGARWTLNSPHQSGERRTYTLYTQYTSVQCTVNSVNPMPIASLVLTINSWKSCSFKPLHPCLDQFHNLTKQHLLATFIGTYVWLLYAPIYMCTCCRVLGTYMCSCCRVCIGTYVCTCCGVAPNFTMCTRFLFQPVLSQYDAKIFLGHCLFWGKRRRVGKGSEITGHCLGRPVDHHRMMLSLPITGWCCGCRWCCGFKRIGTRLVKLIWRFLGHCMYCQALERVGEDVR